MFHRAVHQIVQLLHPLKRNEVTLLTTMNVDISMARDKPYKPRSSKVIISGIVTTRLTVWRNGAWPPQ